MDKELLTIEEVAKALKMSWSWVDKAVRDGRIKHVSLGGSRRVPREELDKIISRGVPK